jgi:hypothetical protein
MLTRSGENEHPCLISDFRGNGFSFSLLSMMLAIAFIMLMYIPSILSFFKACMMKWCWILSKAFSVSIGMIKWFLSLILLMCYTMCIDLCVLNHPSSLGWRWLGHSEWAFWYAVRFSLPLFYWGFLHHCSLRRLAYSWGECNTGFIQWVR